MVQFNRFSLTPFTAYSMDHLRPDHVGPYFVSSAVIAALTMKIQWNLYALRSYKTIHQCILNTLLKQVTRHLERKQKYKVMCYGIWWGRFSSNKYYPAPDGWELHTSTDYIQWEGPSCIPLACFWESQQRAYTRRYSEMHILKWHSTNPRYSFRRELFY